MGDVLTTIAANPGFSISVRRRRRQSSPSSIAPGLQNLGMVNPASESSSLLAFQSSQTWLMQSISRLLNLLKTSEGADAPAASRCLVFLSRLPGEMPEPFLAIGDDGSVGAEWSSRGNYLYLTFGSEGDEVLWNGSNGDEWDATLAMPSPKLLDAIEELIIR